MPEKETIDRADAKWPITSESPVTRDFRMVLDSVVGFGGESAR
jgi:hypothetical protein